MSTWLAQAAPPRPVLLPAGPGDGAAEAWDGQGVLLCPLPARDGPPAGVLAVFGEPPSLAARAETLEVIAGQAAHAAGQNLDPRIPSGRQELVESIIARHCKY